MISIRKPTTFDAPDMAELLNEIVDVGGTTARTQLVTKSDVIELMGHAPEASVWHIARDAKETLVGFQWIEPHSDLPPEAASISTFVRVGQTGLGIGSALFEATLSAAKELGYGWINADIRADNEGGLIYYQSRGFEDYGSRKNITLADGTIVDKRLKRYDL